ncbi:uncharacterized protein TNCV_3687921 [Trichonephila clavipes]|nr:uncharacterized protein TNCV_3687921 [Trichonephila clavipes]
MEVYGGQSDEDQGKTGIIEVAIKTKKTICVFTRGSFPVPVCFLKPSNVYSVEQQGLTFPVKKIVLVGAVESYIICDICERRYSLFLQEVQKPKIGNSSTTKNLSSVKDMRQGIWAIFLHKISTNKNPQHGFCPSGPDTWCRYKKAQLENKVYHHKHKLPVAVVEAIRPIFRDLSDPELLKKMLTWKHAESNESINNVFGLVSPKRHSCT